MHVIPSVRQDERFMRAAIAEARRAEGKTHPNPVVGAVIVKNGRLLARGFHPKAGEPHAEIHALGKLRKPAMARGATLYVTLEPCSTHGLTPPCTEALIEAGFSRVVYGARDPNQKHAGRAKKILEKEGIRVTSGVLGPDCTALNEAWNKWISTGIPYVIAKAGMTLDGRISSHHGHRWITSKASRNNAMHLRAMVQAILIGGETVRCDNPRLTLRGVQGGIQPLRIIWTKSGRLPKNAHVLTDSHKEKTRIYKNQPLKATLQDLGKKGIACVLIEGGGRTLGEAFDHSLVDKIVFYLAPIITGGSVTTVAGKGIETPRKGIQLKNLIASRIGDDIRLEAQIVKNR